MKSRDIPWATPRYWGREVEYAMKAMQSTWISAGSFVDEFESEFAKFCMGTNAVVTSNGTTALHLAFLGAGIERSDEIIVPGFGFMAAANVAIHMGAIPIVSDVDPKTWCMTAENIEKLITSRTKVIVPIHTYGNVCDMEPICEVARKHGVLVIEDAAEAIGSKYKNKMAGTIGHMGTFSFHATKTITTGEGGAVISADHGLIEKMRLYRSHGMSTKRYWHDVAGHNFRLTNMQAAIGCAQLEHIEEIEQERGRVYKTYKECLTNIDGVIPQKFENSVEPLVWAVGIKLNKSAFPQGRDTVIKQLEEMGIETRPGFYSASMMRHLYGVIQSPVSDEVSLQILSLPSSPTVSNGDISYICDSLSSLRR